MATVTATRTHQVNGVDLDILMETVGAIQKDRDMGIARFRASNTWMNGAQNRSEVTGFYGARQEIPHAKPFAMEADEPPILAGSDTAPNPVEHLLHALASCLTTSMVAHAAVRGLEIEALEAELAAFVGQPRALLFSTGFMANQGILTALLDRSDAVFEDRLNHASLLDGATLQGTVNDDGQPGGQHQPA